MNNRIVEIKNTTDGINSRMGTIHEHLMSWKIKLSKSPRKKL